MIALIPLIEAEKKFLMLDFYLYVHAWDNTLNLKLSSIGRFLEFDNYCYYLLNWNYQDFKCNGVNKVFLEILFYLCTFFSTLYRHFKIMMAEQFHKYKRKLWMYVIFSFIMHIFNGINYVGEKNMQQHLSKDEFNYKKMNKKFCVSKNIFLQCILIIPHLYSVPTSILKNKLSI